MGPPPSPGEGGHEHQGPVYRVRLTLVASINPEYDLTVPFFPSNRLMLTRFLESCSAM